MLNSSDANEMLGGHITQFLSDDEVQFIETYGSWAGTNASLSVEKLFRFRNQCNTLKIVPTSGTSVSITHDPKKVADEYALDAITFTAFVYPLKTITGTVTIEDSLGASETSITYTLPALKWTLIRGPELRVVEVLGSINFKATVTFSGTEVGSALYVGHPSLINSFGFTDNDFVRECLVYMPPVFPEIDSEQSNPSFPMARMMDIGLVSADRGFKQSINFRYVDTEMGYDPNDDTTKSTLVDYETAEPEYLTWLAQFVGVRLKTTPAGTTPWGNLPTTWKKIQLDIDPAADVTYSISSISRASSSLTSWTTQTSNFGTTTIISVAYGNNLWVAGGVGGQLRTSTDGITWVTQGSNFGALNINSVAYGNSLWVAGGNSGQLRTSTDGITWVTQTSRFGTTHIMSVAYGNGLWVASGGSGQIRTSTDAITWTTRTSTFDTSIIYSLNYGNGTWVAVGASGGIGTSTDGVTWVTRSSNFGATVISDVAYGSGLWVAAGDTGQIRTSTDAITWVTQTSNFGTTDINSVAYENGLWVAGGNAGQLRTSTDGITWVTQTSNFGTTTIFSVAYGNGLWAAAGSAGQIRTASSLSSDSVSATLTSSPSLLSSGNTITITGTTAFNGQFVITNVNLGAKTIEWISTGSAVTESSGYVTYVDETWIELEAYDIADANFIPGRRDLIRTARTGLNAGSKQAIIDAMLPILSGNKRYKYILDSYSNPWNISLQTLTAETPGGITGASNTSIIQAVSQCRPIGFTITHQCVASF